MPTARKLAQSTPAEVAAPTHLVSSGVDARKVGPPEAPVGDFDSGLFEQVLKDFNELAEQIAALPPNYVEDLSKLSPAERRALKEDLRKLEPMIALSGVVHAALEKNGGARLTDEQAQEATDAYNRKWQQVFGPPTRA